jgi:hypothetical protein
MRSGIVVISTPDITRRGTSAHWPTGQISASDWRVLRLARWPGGGRSVWAEGRAAFRSVGRSAQEALRKVARHFQAERPSRFLPGCGGERERGAFELVVADEGRGFDHEAARPGSLGLGIMAERADSIGTRLELSSSDDGACVRAVWRP